jgi:LuxR family maltose regulon positive regulatory protein
LLELTIFVVMIPPHRCNGFPFDLARAWWAIRTTKRSGRESEVGMIPQNHLNEWVGMTEILATKVAHPRLRLPFVKRISLLEKLSLALERRLTLVSAPAGFGKTHLISQWISDNSFPSAWLTLDEGDNDPVRFLHYLIAVCQQFYPDVGSAALKLLKTQQYRPDAVLTSLLNDMSRHKGIHVLVFDDYHTITSIHVHDLVSSMLEHLPSSLHLVIVTRTDPPLPLARMRAHDELLELRAADLRFSRDETTAFLHQSLPEALPESGIEKLEAVTEGWIVGLRIAALMLKEQHPAERGRVLNAFSGSHRHVLEYLSAEVLSALPESQDEFLLQVAFLHHLSGSLCDAVTLRDDSQELLQTLERANLFLMSLDDTATWYRLHPLVAEALRQIAQKQMGTDAVRELHRRASRWYEAHGHLQEAVEAALTAHAFAEAAPLIERLIEPQLVKRNTEYHTLRRWIEQLPDDLLRRHPALCLTLGAAILFTSDRHAPTTAMQIERVLRMAADQWAAEGNAGKVGELLAFRTLVEYWQGNLAQVFETSRQALELLPDSQTEWRAVLLLNLGMEQYLLGENAAARRLTEESERLNRYVGNEFAKRSALWLKGQVALSQGSLDEAEQLFRELLMSPTAQPREHTGAYIGLATIAFERNDLERAERDVLKAFTTAESVGDKYMLVDAAILRARLLHLRGDTDGARDLLQALAARVDMAVHVRTLRAWGALLALISGDISAANAWQVALQQKESSPFLLQQEREALVTARLLLAQGRTASASDLLEPWHRRCTSGQRTRSELEILILKALIYAVDRALPQAYATLSQALEFAYRAGYIRPFLQEGEAMALLLRGVRQVIIWS